MASVSSARDRALRTLSAGHFHQCLWLPQTTDHPRLRVTYATTSNFSDETLPAILFIGPMFGSRYLTLEIDKLARDCGVRVIVPERHVFVSNYSLHSNNLLTPVQTRRRRLHTRRPEHQDESLARDRTGLALQDQRRACQPHHAQRRWGVHIQHTRRTTTHP